MKEKVRRVMDYIHDIAWNELQGGSYIEFLENIERELEREIEEEDWIGTDTDE